MKEDNIFLWCLFVILFLLVMGLTCAYQRDTLKREAVERGHAEWVVEANGNTTWQWK